MKNKQLQFTLSNAMVPSVGPLLDCL